MSFKETLKSTSFSESINLESNDVAYLLSMIDNEKDERILSKHIDSYRTNLEAIEQLKDIESKYLAIEEEYQAINKEVNMESIDTVVSLASIQERLLDLSINFKHINRLDYLSTNSESLVYNVEGLMTELSNSIGQAFSNLVSSFSKSIKGIQNVFASLVGTRKRKLTALRARLANVGKFSVSSYSNNEFLNEYFAPLKLSNFDVQKTLEQIEDLQSFVQGLLAGKYPDDTGSIGVVMDKNHPDIQDRAREIQDYTTYRNYSSMRLNGVKCLGYRYNNNTLKAYLSFIFKVPKEDITKFPFSLRDFKNVNYGPIKIMDGKDVYVRVNETVAINYRYETKTIKFDKAVAMRAIDNELLRVNKISGIILKSNIQDIVKSLQSIALGISSSFDKAVPVGIAREVDIATTAINPLFSLLKLLFNGNKLTDWFVLTYHKSYSGLVEMSKMNYEMLVDYSKTIINSAE